MARRRKKKSKFQILTIIMAVLMAVITLAGIIVTIIPGLLGE
ncbi:MAG: DUF4044 domain-containing protein [Candidatus Lactobacillus pullistercoris]|uniref:DUF4044 domain-containing protein n=1 Tax=Candidatus Lactobacillus pullistercoris TaxID=2838636 RepID=A0A9E2KSB5_9LACO|nr:DUF4044 domain-containing protein [Candidatus Lactobacillus pullistercoris]